MAALLRSARLLKLSPSGLLQITGTKRNGPPLGRLYSGAFGGGRPGVCAPQTGHASGKTSSRAWPCAVGYVRNYTLAREQKYEASTAVQSKQAQQFDWALAKLDNSVRRTGRITKTLLLRIFHDICREGYPSGNQALLLLRSCGSLLPELPMEERSQLVHHMWEKLQELGAQYDVSHYNALLKVHLQNEFKFSPTDFLAKMEAANVQPNRVTYQRLIAAYCQNGDIEGVSTILGFMKSKDLPITEAVFNALVTGHARAGDIENSKNILSVMRGAGIEPGPDTYVSLLNAYAEKGDLDSLKMTLEAAESADSSLMDSDILRVIFTLAKAGHEQYIPDMVERLRHERGFVPEAINLCLSLITNRREDTAFHILKTFSTLQLESFISDSANLGNFFLRHCVNRDTPLEKMGSFCKELQDLNLHTAPFAFTLFCALEANKTVMSLGLMEMMKQEDLPIRSHYFWPLLTQHIKDNNSTGLIEVVKGMQKLQVCPDVETLSRFILPVFPSIEAARQALKDIGISVESKDFLSIEVRLMAADDLAKLYTTLSDPSCPSINLSTFRSSLIVGFKKSSDVETMVKITELLYKDSRFSTSEGAKTPEVGSFFLYNLIESMEEAEAQAQEDKLRKYFNQLQAKDITISENIYRGIRNLLKSYQVPELLKDVDALVHRKRRVSSGSTPAFLYPSGGVLALETKLTELKAEDKPLGGVLKQAIQLLCAEENLQRALELKQEHEAEMTSGGYITLINAYCRHNNAEEAFNLKRELSRKDSSIVLDPSKYISLVKTFAINDKLEEAVDILKEMKEKNVQLNDLHGTMLFHMLSSVVEKGGASTFRRLLDTIFTLGLAKPTANLCSPLVTAYLNKNDLSSALEAALECQKLYNHLPRIHDIIVALVEKGDTDLLQKVLDIVRQERGEMIMLYDLFFAFLQTGRYREARKIIETPGLRSRPGQLQWYAKRCIASNKMEPLEQMVDMTAKLFECDRDEMYSYVLQLCKQSNNWQKAEALWTKMQEENVIPRERTLRLLADVLKKNGQEVPFKVPQTLYEQAAPEQQVKTATTDESGRQYETRLLALCKNGKADDAYTLLKESDGKGMALSSSIYDQIIRALMAQGYIEDALAVKDIAVSRVPNFVLSDIATSLLIITLSVKGQSKEALEQLKSMVQMKRVPLRRSITKLVQALGSHGDVAGIQEVESLMKGIGLSQNLSSMVFINNQALAHIKNGDLESAVELFEALYTSPASKHPSMSYVFRKILEDNNDEALDKLSAMAERLANHFACYRPASDLFLELLDVDKVEDAKFMLARCNAVAEQKEILMSYMSKKAQSPGQVGKIKALLSLIPDFTEKDVLYTYLMKCHILDQDLPSAKALYEQIHEEGAVMDELSLKRLAGLYRHAGEALPFTEPPESFKFYADKLKEKAAKAQMARDS